MSKVNRKKVFKIIIIVIIVLMAALGIGAFILNRVLSNKSLEKPGEELGYDIFIGDENLPVTTAEDEGRNLANEIKDLNATYKDAVLWLKVPGTSIDTPVFQSTDNTRYYRNDRDNKKTKWGETYLDYRVDVSDITKAMNHVIIYGHNTETDNRFTPLLNYKRQEFYNTHKYIQLATVDKTYLYEIFSVYTTDTKFFYIDTVFDSNAEYSNFLNSLANKSRYGTDVSVSENDNILTLSTCDYSITDGRFVVHAKLVN